jgi:hypothetical protein
LLVSDVIPLPSLSETDRVLSFDPSLKQRIANWKAALPLHHWSVVRSVDDYIAYKLGRRDLDFVIEAERRAIEGLIVLYDLVATDDEKKDMRKVFRDIMSRRRGLAPFCDELYAPLRTRLREHKMYVRCGLDPPDEPRGKRNAAA